MKDLVQFREAWEDAPDENIKNQINALESTINMLKNQLYTHSIPRRQFYTLYEEPALQTQQLQHILKFRGFR